jgi:flagellar basal body L-ring protein FlgH
MITNSGEEAILELMERMAAKQTVGTIMYGSLVAGGTRTGSGGPIKPLIGKWRQTDVVFDDTESADITIPSGELASLINNLNRIRAGITIASGAIHSYQITASGITDGYSLVARDGLGNWELITGSGGGLGHTIQDEGVDLPTRAKLDFIGATVTVTDDAINNATKVIITAGSGGGVTDHGALTGLGDDDHTQYLNIARHAAIDAADHSSGAATDGYILTADGLGGAAWEIVPSGGSSGHEIQYSGISMPSRNALDFQGAAIVVTDDAINDRTIVTVHQDTWNVNKTVTNTTGNIYQVYGGYYASGSLMVYVNGQLQVPGTDYTETHPETGLFEFNIGSVPSGIETIRATYGLAGEVSTGGHTIQDEGVNLAQRTKLNFIGANVTVSDDSVNDATKITITASGSGHIIQDEGSNLTTRSKLNFVGDGVTAADNSGTDTTTVTIPGVASAGILSNTTKTVGVGKDFSTIQGALDWFKGYIIGGGCIIDIDAGTYAENLDFDGLCILERDGLLIRGDTRILAGQFYYGSTSLGIVYTGIYSGSGTASMTNDASSITVTGNSTNPNFSSGGWGNGDKVLFSNTATATEADIITVTLNGSNNNILSTGTALNTSYSPMLLILIPRVEISMGVGIYGVRNICIQGIHFSAGLYCYYNSVVTLSGVLIKDFYIAYNSYVAKSTTGYPIAVYGSGVSQSYVNVSGKSYFNAPFIRTFDVNINADIDSYIDVSNCGVVGGEVSAYNKSYVNAAGVVFSMTTYGVFASLMSTVYASGTKIKTFNSTAPSYGFYAGDASFIYADGTNAFNQGSTKYSPGTSGTPGNNNSVIVWS